MFQGGVIALIVAALGGAVYLAQRPTIATGEGLAAELHDLSLFHDRPISAIACPDDVPVGVDGADFTCRVDDTPYHCRIYRTGSIRCEATE